jgi:hypothetical protein
MNMTTAFDLLTALLVIMVVALQVQIIKLNKKLASLSGGNPEA